MAEIDEAIEYLGLTGSEAEHYRDAPLSFVKMKIGARDNLEMAVNKAVEEIESLQSELREAREEIERLRADLLTAFQEVSFNHQVGCVVATDPERCDCQLARTIYVWRPIYRRHKAILRKAFKGTWEPTDGEGGER